MSTLDDALRLRPDGPGRWLAHADRDHESLSAMFGGWTAAVAVAAVVGSADGSGTPRAVTVNYVTAITPGDDVAIQVQHLGGGRSIGHWRADVETTDGTLLARGATVVLANRRASVPHDQLTMPLAPDPDTLDEFHAPGPQGAETLIRPIHGDFTIGDTSSSHWIRTVPPRRLDHLQLVYLADQFAPRSFFWNGGPRPSATLTMSVYIHATAEEIDSVDDDYVLGEAVGTRAQGSASGQQARLWSRHGALLATSEQLAWYR